MKNMKTKKSYLPIAFVLLLTGCTSVAVDEIAKQTVPLSLSATYSADITLGTRSSVDLPSGINAGIYVAQKDTAISASYFANQLYLCGASGSMSTEGNVSLTVGRSYDIYAYAPYQATVINPDSIVMAHGTDVLWAEKATLNDVSEDNHSASLAFSHRAAQVSFKVVFASDFSMGSTTFTSDSKIVVSGFYDQGALDVATGVLTPGSLRTKVMSGSGAGTSGSMTLGIDATCFIPALTAMDLDVQVTHEGYVYHATISHLFAAGSYTQYTVTVKGVSRVLDITSTIIDWVPVTEKIDL
jgi:hypothetical protein